MHNKIQLCEEEKNVSEKSQIENMCQTFIYQDQNEFPAMEEVEKTTKIMKENVQELQLCEREKLMDEQQDGDEFPSTYSPKNSKTCFPKNGWLPNLNFTPYSTHPHALTNSTTFG